MPVCRAVSAEQAAIGRVVHRAVHRLVRLVVRAFR